MSIPGAGVVVPDGAAWIVTVAGLMALTTLFIVFTVGVRTFAQMIWKKKDNASNGDRRRELDRILSQMANALETILSRNGHESVTKEEMSHMIKTQSPYIEDRNMIRDNLTKLNVNVEKTTEEVSNLQIGQAKIHVKLDTILQNGRKDAH